MHKQITQLLPGVFCVVGFLLLTAGIQAQDKLTLRPASGAPTGRNVKAEESTGKQKKILLPPQSPGTRPDVLPQSDNRSSSQAKSAKTQTETAAAAPLSPECSWTLLLLNEFKSYQLVSSGVPCLGCRIATNLSQSTAGILGFSSSPSGPWSETHTVYTNLDFSGNGVSELFYIKGLVVGESTVHAQNPWSSIDVEFQVQPCACPSIPIVP
ncbi:MAG: hypothetical protein ACXWID_02445 [Pyrinomonadaceae bacterium]